MLLHMVLEYNIAQPEVLKIRSRHYHVPDAPAILQTAGRTLGAISTMPV